VIYDALKRLTKHSAIYALGPAVQKVLGFLLMPLVLAYVVGAANYGIVDLSAVTIALAAQCLGINLLHGMTRYYAEYETEKERGTLVTTCLLLLGATTGTALAAAALFAGPGAQLLFGASEYARAFVVVAAILFLQTVGQVGLRWLQILERSVAYGVLTTAKTGLEIGLKIWFLVGLGLAYMGVLYSVLGGELVVAAGMLVWMVRRLGLGFSWPMAKRLLRYSYPLVLSGLLMFVLHSADRYFVKGMSGLAAVGIYGTGYKLGTIANAMFLDAFGLIWFPYVFAVKDPETVRTLCRKVLTDLLYPDYAKNWETAIQDRTLSHAPPAKITALPLTRVSLPVRLSMKTTPSALPFLLSVTSRQWALGMMSRLPLRSAGGRWTVVE